MTAVGGVTQQYRKDLFARGTMHFCSCGDGARRAVPCPPAEEGPHQGAGLFSPAPTRNTAVGVGTGTAGLVKAKAAAFQQRIQQGEETRLKAEEAKRRQDRDAEAQARCVWLRCGLL